MPLMDEVRQIRRRLNRVGFDGLTSNTWNPRLNGGCPPESRAVAISPVLEEIRSVKTPEEIDIIRRSVVANSKALAAALRGFKPSMTEADLAAELEYQQRRLGAEKPVLRDHRGVRRADRAAARASDSRRSPKDELLLIDMGAFQDGYASDMTRTLHLGRPSAQIGKMYRPCSKRNWRRSMPFATAYTPPGGRSGGPPEACSRPRDGPAVHPLHRARPGAGNS